MIFEGSAVALVTPFLKNGDVDYFSLKNLIEYQITNNTKAIIILGTTGESSTITNDERTKIIKFCVCLINKRIPLIVGTGSNSTHSTIKQTKEAETLGADAVLIVTPYYNKSNQQGLYFHYKKIALSTKIPIILYNVPSRTGVNLEAKTTLKLSKIKNIVAIKESSGNFTQIAEIIKHKPKDFCVYSGDDMLTLPILAMGGSGVISVTANCYPEQISLVCEHIKNGDIFNAQRINNHLFEINKTLFLDVNPLPIKFYMNLIGFNVGKPRPPLFSIDSKTKQKLIKVKDLYEN